MKIFIGGGKTKHNDRFTKRYPQVQFEFAAEDESPQRWNSKAQHCDHYIVLQHRTTHRHIAYLSARRIQPHFTDRIPKVYQLIEEIISGEISHHYVGAGGSQSAPVLPAKPS